METWTWPTGAPADERRALPLFSLLPDWKGGITETLSWLTDIMVSEQNVEQRRSVRRFPRRTFEASYLRAGANRARIDNFFAGVGRKLVLMPMYHEQFSITGTGRNDGLVQFPIGTLAQREFRLNDLVMITTGEPTETFVLTVTEHDVLTDTIVLRGVAASGPWPTGSRIIPLRVARVLDATALNNVSDRVANSQVRFQCMDTDENFVGDWGYCSPLWRIKPDRKGNVDTSYDRKDYVLDFEAGVIDLTETSDRSAIGTAMRFIFQGREQMTQVRAFLYNARGRARRFYMPSFTSDLTPAQDIATGNTFDVKPSGFIDYMDVPQEARRIITVEFNDGRVPIYRTITSVANIANLSAPFNTRVERITVDQDMPPIRIDEIARISFIVPSRLDQDSIELFHHTAGLKAVSMAMVTKSSVVDGMPPIECWTTSLTYSLLEIEQLQSAGSITAGRLYSPEQTAPPESMDSNSTLTEGTLRLALQSNDAPVESMDSNATITSGTLPVTLRTYTVYEPDQMASSAIMVSGTMPSALITYTSPPETIQSTATLTEGTLT